MECTQARDARVTGCKRVLELVNASVADAPLLDTVPALLARARRVAGA